MYFEMLRMFHMLYFILYTFLILFQFLQENEAEIREAI